MKQGDKTRQEILNAANNLFYHQGYSGTSFSDIVEKTGLSKGNITYHFKNKASILEAIVNSRLTGIDNLLSTWNQEIDHPVTRLERFCDMLLNEAENLQNFGCPMGTLTGELAKNSPDLYEIALPMLNRFRIWLTGQYQSLGLTPKRADEQAMELLASVQGISVMTHVFKDRVFLEREIKKLKRQLRSAFKDIH